jgi:hypothetical protein
MSDLQLFIDALAEGLLPDERLNASAFIGDPSTAKKFKPYGVFQRDGRWVFPGNEEYNRYVTVGAFHQNESGEWRRQGAYFAAACAMMIDDIGDDGGLGVKLPKSVVKGLPPTFIIETSQGNFQYWYLFNEPFRDRFKFERLVDAFIETRCGGKDSGFRDATRVGRTPDSTNSKPGKNNWRVQMRKANLLARYSPQDLAEFWGLDMTPRYRRQPIGINGDAEGRIYNFEIILQHLNYMNLTKGGKTGLNRAGHIDYSDYNRNGWMEITCPWVDEHTARADNGSSIQAPLERNGMLGGFQCHHASCKETRDLKALLKFVKEQMSDEWADAVAKQLDEANRRNCI